MFDVLDHSRMPGSPDPAAQALRSVSGETTRAFAQAIAEITRVRAAERGIMESAEDLLNAISAAEGDRTGEEDRSHVHLSGAVESAGRLGRALADADLRRRCLLLEARLEEAERAARELLVISMMTKIGSVDSDWAREEAEGYTRMLDELVTRLLDDIRRARARVAPISAHASATAAAVEGAAEALAAARDDVSSGAQRAAALLRERDLRIAEMKAETSELAAHLREEIGRLVPCLQFADALYQRTDNAGRLLEAAKGRTSEEQGAAAGLAAAQVEAVAADARAVQAQAETALARALERAEQGAESLAPQGDDAARLWLNAHGAAIALRGRAVADARTRLGEADRLLEDVARAASEATSAIAGFDDLVWRLELAGSNAAIAAARSSRKTGALHFLASQVQSASKVCAERLQAAADALNAIQSSLESLDRAALTRELDALARGGEAADAAAAAQAEALEAQTDARKRLSAGVIDLTGAARSALEAIRRAATNQTSLLGAAAELRSLGTPLDTGVDLQWAWAFYTTQPERETHRGLVGDAAAPASASGREEEEEEDDLEDFLL